jgi:hypothetical protein
MSSVNDSPNRFILLDTVSRRRKIIAKVMSVDGIGQGGKNAGLAALHSDRMELQEGEKQ